MGILLAWNQHPRLQDNSSSPPWALMFYVGSVVLASNWHPGRLGILCTWDLSFLPGHSSRPTALPIIIRLELHQDPFWYQRLLQAEDQFSLWNVPCICDTSMFPILVDRLEYGWVLECCELSVVRQCQFSISWKSGGVALQVLESCLLVVDWAEGMKLQQEVFPTVAMLWFASYAHIIPLCPAPGTASQWVLGLIHV